MGTFSIESLITDLALILSLGAISTIIFKKLKQPVVLGYIVAGFLASPHFALLPSVVGEENIEFWAQIGIIVLLFSLGLEFSFKKLMNVGGSAVVTALIIVIGMTGVGFVTGKILDFSTINCLFLGGMLSMSSTTIIIKAFTDLNMRARRFVPGVFAVLIVEDLFAVVMMVILSSVAINNSVAGGEMLWSIVKLVFFLVIWFTVGVFVIPSIFNRIRRIMSDELMLVISMGLCFLMAVFSVNSGFSMALGAFLMGSILAGTSEAEHIEHVITPVKDLFGAVFFISVGMMVNPQIIAEYWQTIALLSIVVVVGMILFGTFGMLATGKSLKIAMESGFSLTQIGEFAFIIASLGMTLNVLEPTLYPIVVAVSVITTFFTPFFIKSAIPCYNFVEKHLPKRLSVLLEGYQKNADESDNGASRNMWAKVVKRYLLRLILYSVVVVAIIIVSKTYFIPYVQDVINSPWGTNLGVLITFFVMLPFLIAIISPVIKKAEHDELMSNGGAVSYVPAVVMFIMSVIVVIFFMTMLMHGLYSGEAAVLTALGLMIGIIILFAPIARKNLNNIEKHFMENMNQRENRRTGKGNRLVSDLHLAFMTVGTGCPFVGERLRNADIRRNYGMNVVSIQRGTVRHMVPSSEMRIFPGDILGVIGDDEQIQNILPVVEANAEPVSVAYDDVRFTHFALSENSVIVGKSLIEARLREDYSSLLVSVQRGADNFITPTPELIFAAGDIIWIVGDVNRLNELK